MMLKEINKTYISYIARTNEVWVYTITRYEKGEHTYFVKFHKTPPNFKNPFTEERVGIQSMVDRNAKEIVLNDLQKIYYNV